MTQFVSPDDEHDVLETCRVKNKNKYIERNLYVTLVIYQESLHDARSTKYKSLRSSLNEGVTQISHSFSPNHNDSVSRASDNIDKRAKHGGIFILPKRY